MPRRLQNKIHSEYSTNIQLWINYRDQIKVLWAASANKTDFNAHLIREFNRKVARLKLSPLLYIFPLDSGGSYKGSNSSPLP
jgi:hypothetical protein